MSTHNVCFHGEIRKMLCGYPLLSVAMYSNLHFINMCYDYHSTFFINCKYLLFLIMTSLNPLE